MDLFPTHFEMQILNSIHTLTLLENLIVPTRKIGLNFWKFVTESWTKHVMIQLALDIHFPNLKKGRQVIGGWEALIMFLEIECLSNLFKFIIMFTKRNKRFCHLFL